MFDKIKTLLGHTLIYGFGNSGSRFVGFLLLPLYTRYLTPEDYGVLSLVAMLGQILFVVMSMGQGTAVFRSYFNHEDTARRDEVITTAFWLIVLISLPIALATLALSRPLTFVLTGRLDYTTWVLLGIVGVAVKVLLRLPFTVLRARRQSWRYAIWSFVQTVSTILLAVLLVAGFHLGGKGVLLSQLIGGVIVCAYLVPATARGLKLRFSRKDASELVGWGAYQVPAALLGFVLHMSDRYFLKHFATLYAVGLYSLGSRFGEILSVALMAFGLAWQPFLFEQRKDKNAPALYARVCTYFAAVMVFLWLCVSLFAREAITIMAQPAFHEAYRVVPWTAGAFLFQALAGIANIGIVLQRKVQYRPLILGAATAINLGLNYVLVPRYDMMGAGAAACVSFFAWFVMQAALAQRLYHVPYEYGRLGRLAVVAVVLYAGGSAIAWSSLYTALAGKAGLLLCAPLLLYASGFFMTGEIAQIRRLLVRMRLGGGPVSAERAGP
jgi:O-antigen/teichoic acid export membrane protein